MSSAGSGLGLMPGLRKYFQHKTVDWYWDCYLFLLQLLAGGCMVLTCISNTKFRDLRPLPVSYRKGQRDDDSHKCNVSCVVLRRSYSLQRHFEIAPSNDNRALRRHCNAKVLTQTRGPCHHL